MVEIVIALDAMGGDHAPQSIIAGAIIASELNPNVIFKIYGDETQLGPLIEGSIIENKCEIIHCFEIVGPDEKPSSALRNRKNSSMTSAINAVRDNEANAVVSSGNTGALMAISKVHLRMLPTIERPAICTLLPTQTASLVMLDLGANVDCNADILYQFAVMGDAYAKIILGIESPTIALLNVGSEHNKGNDIIKVAHGLLANNNVGLNFIGFVEGDDIAKGSADVVVTDGFTGNIALKTAEGTAGLCTNFLKEAFKESILAKIGYLFAKNALKKVFKRVDKRLYNGAMLIGLNGIVIKSHGSADDIACGNAINNAIKLALNDINDKITNVIKN